MQIYTDDQGTFWLVFAFFLLVATIPECITSLWSVVIKLG